MRIVRAGEGRRVPWKNGGGWTAEIAVDPENMGLDDFTWRLSSAWVTADGPFSLFPDVDRSLAILGGRGLRLTVAARDHVVEATRPLAFAGDVPTRAVLLGGPVTDLNVMTRRSRARHLLRRCTVDGARDIVGEATTRLVYCAVGRLILTEASTLNEGDCIISGPQPLRLDGSGIALVVDVTVL